jgi:CBS domain containing-hemolysin-like protein
MIVSSLKRTFGTTTHDCKRGTTTSTKILDCTVWDGRKVKLEHVRVDFDPNNTEKDGYNSIMGWVLFTEKDIQKEQDSSEVDW